MVSGFRNENVRVRGILILIISMLLLIIISPATFCQQPDSLHYSRNLTLEEVSVIGQRTPSVYDQVARKITVITKEEISSSPVSTIQDLLEYITSIDVRQRNVHGVQADVQIRGGSFDQVMILLNGVNISDHQTGHFNLDLPITLSSVERIEILHGSGSRIYGANAHKGVINIITAKNLSNVTAEVSAGQYGLLNSSLAGNLSKGKFYNGLNVSRNVSDGFTSNTDYKLRNIFYQGGAYLKPLDVSWQTGLSNKAFGANNFYSPRFPEQFEETGTMYGSLNLASKGKI